MDFKEAINIVSKVLNVLGSVIDPNKYDGLIVKRLEVSNTLDKGRTTKQSHIAITGSQMEIFPYVRAEGYFDVEYEDADSTLKKYFAAQIPVYLHNENISYLDSDSNIIDSAEQLVYITIVRSRRNNAADQIQMSMTYMDSPEYVSYRRIVHEGSYMILLKRSKELLYDLYSVKSEDVSIDGVSLQDLNNCFCKLATSTAVKLDEIETPKELLSENSSENDYEDIFNHHLFGMHITEKNDALSEENPHICIGWSRLGDLSNINNKDELRELYSSKFDANNRAKGQDVGQIWMFLKEIQIGDYVIFADGKVINIGRIESDYYYDVPVRDEQSVDYANNRKVKWLMKDVSRSVLSSNLHNSLKPQRSIWRLNDYKSVVVDLLKGTYEKDEGNGEMPLLKSCLEVVRNPRSLKIHPLNSIVYGAPGTGKTYSMVDYALAIVDGEPIYEFKQKNTDRKANIERYKNLVKEGRIVFTTFHQNYGYEEFIQGLRPDINSSTMSFKIVDGVFKKIADAALNDTEGRNYIIIIDEINRANISKVFGELITLIEEDKRWGEINEVSVTLQSGDQFAVPNNLYIIGTMNSADKSISLIDAALRRRFDFIEQKPDSSLVQDMVLKAILESINSKLVEELESTDLLVGHSYFMNKTEKDLCTILNNNIIPLLYEYFYDNRKKVASILTDAIKNANAAVDVVDDKVGRLRVKEA